jgi:phospholipase C
MKANTTASFLSLFATSTSIVSNTVEAIFGRSNTTVTPPTTGSPPPFGYTAGSPESIANLKDKIKHVVWVLLENRSFDNILGGVNRPGLDNPTNNGDVCIPVNVTDPSVTQCTRSKDFDSVLQDPDHSVTGNNFEFYSTFVPDDAAIQNGSLTATNQGFVQQQMLVWGPLGGENNTVALSAAQVMGYYDEEEVPTIVDLVDGFTTFNYWFSCIPGVCAPPHAALLTTG